MNAHFLITHSDEPLSSDTGKIHQSDEFIYCLLDTNLDDLTARIQTAMDAKYGEGKWKREYFFGIKDTDSYGTPLPNGINDPTMTIGSFNLAASVSMSVGRLVKYDPESKAATINGRAIISHS